MRAKNSTMRRHWPLAVLVSTLALFIGCATGTDAVVEPRITVSEPQAVTAGDDIFNAAMASALTPGLVVTIRVAPNVIELQDGRMMLVPKLRRRSDPAGDRIMVRSFGRGLQVSEVTVNDPVILFLEGKGQARLEDRTLSVAIPTPSLVDTLEVVVSSSGASKRFDVSQIVREYCARAESAATCLPGTSDQGQRR